MPFFVVRGLSRARTQGKLHLGNVHFICALGRGGRKPKRCEGDGVTPIGTHPVRRVFYRPDRVIRPRTALPVLPLAPDMGWCDAPGDANYNRLIRRPYPASHETLWRDDHLYDLIVVLAYNERPRVSGRGSAIFLHLARPDLSATEGCVALCRQDMLRFLDLSRPGAAIRIE